MKKEIYASIEGTIKDNIIALFSKKYYRHLKNSNVKYYLNDKDALSYYEVKINDRISFEFDDYINKDELLYDLKLDIIYEDENYLIVNKPVHLQIIPSTSEPIKSLYNAIYTYLKNNNKLNSIHIITRLDKETSGLVLVALNKETAIYMNKNHHNINKIYYAKVIGHVKEDHFFIEEAIKRVENTIKREVNKDGSYAKTEVFLFKRELNHDILKIKLYTGKTHQIRVHLNYIGNTILGDSLYGEKLDFMYLHAAELEFVDIKGNVLSFKVKPDWMV